MHRAWASWYRSVYGVDELIFGQVTTPSFSTSSIPPSTPVMCNCAAACNVAHAVATAVVVFAAAAAAAAAEGAGMAERDIKVDVEVEFDKEVLIDVVEGVEVCGSFFDVLRLLDEGLSLLLPVLICLSKL